jgi:hypothetical protein
LVDIHSQRSVKAFGDLRHIRETQVIRLHHDRNDGDRNSEPETPFCLLMDQFPIAMPALCILFHLRRVIERELDVMEGSQFVIC